MEWLLITNLPVDNFNSALENAARGGYLEIAEWAVENGATSLEGFNRALKGAAKGGYLEIIEWAIENGADDFNDALLEAIK